ncbi:hypothetical protein C7460_1251, partial [Marinoscillum furvescens DSM 4134]
RFLNAGGKPMWVGMGAGDRFVDYQQYKDGEAMDPI